MCLYPSLFKNFVCEGEGYIRHLVKAVAVIDHFNNADFLVSAVVVEGDFAYFTDFVRATNDIFNDFLFIFALVADDYCLHTADDHLHCKDYDDYAEHYAKDCVHCVVNVAGHNVGHK